MASVLHEPRHLALETRIGSRILPAEVIDPRCLQPLRHHLLPQLLPFAAAEQISFSGNLWTPPLPPSAQPDHSEPSGDSHRASRGPSHPRVAALLCLPPAGVEVLAQCSSTPSNASVRFVMTYSFFCPSFLPLPCSVSPRLQASPMRSSSAADRTSLRPARFHQ